MDDTAEEHMRWSLTNEALSLDLCEDYFSKHPFASAGLPTPPESLHADLADPPDVQSVGLLAALGALNGTTAHERWDVDRETAEYLGTVFSLAKHEISMTDVEDVTPNFADLRLPEALLHEDQELQLRRLRQRNVATISARGMEPFKVKVEDGEGMEWAPKDYSLPAKIDREVNSETLDVDPDVMEYLRQDIVGVDSMDFRDMIDALLECEREPGPRHETPPLMPLSPPFSPTLFPEAMMDIDLTSTPEDLIAKEAAEVDRQIMAMDDSPADTNVRAPGERSEALSILNTPCTSSTSQSQHVGLEDLRVEAPLTPQDGTSSSRGGFRLPTFPTDTHDLVPPPESQTSIFDPEVAEQDLEALAEDVLMPLAKAAVEQIGNEQLVEIDTTLRLPVTRIDDEAPPAPWDIYTRSTSSDMQSHGQRTLLSRTQKELCEEEKRWSGVSKLEKMLAWTAFPVRLGKVHLDEDLDDDKSCSRYMGELKFSEDFEVECLISKPEGLRLLDSHDSDDDELEMMESQHGNLDVCEADVCDNGQHQMQSNVTETVDVLSDLEVALNAMESKSTSMLRTHGDATLPKAVEMRASTGLPNVRKVMVTANKVAPAPGSGKLDMQTLLRKRKLELEEGKQVSAKKINSDQANGFTAINRPSLAASDETGRPNKINAVLEHDGIASFMQLNGAPLLRQPVAQTMAQTRLQEARKAVPAAVMLPPPRATVVEIKRKEIVSLPVPLLSKVDSPIQIIVHARLLADRGFLRKLANLLPSLDYIERDVVPTETAKADTKLKCNEEADLTLSPAAGLLTTTIQKLKQKALPGQSSFFGVRERIQAVSYTYELLIVMVSEGHQDTSDVESPEYALDERDCAALADLQGFVATLDCDVEVKYIPGGEDVLSEWVAAVISQHAMSSSKAKLLPDETLWERFLRVAGMNPSAAQLVLGELKLPEALPASDSSTTELSSRSRSFGLASFIRMPVAQRIERFAPMLGGDRVLRRVSNIIDGEWTAASI